MRTKLFAFFQPLVAVAFGLFLGLILCTFAGENPLFVLQVLIRSAFGSPYDFGMTLFYSTPLLFTGLAVSMAFTAGLFNIGAEGQLTMGALCCAIVGLSFPTLPPFLAIPLGILAAFTGGALWGLISGVLRAKRGGHEVITTVMLNFIAYGLSSYATLYLFRNTSTQNPETLAVGPGFILSQWKMFAGAPLGASLLLAIICALILWFVFNKTKLGFELLSTGENLFAAKASGIKVQNMYMLSMFLAGGLAGLVGVMEVMGNAERFRLGFSPGYGFIGIAVALLARGRPLGVIFSALLFGALHKGTADLDFETQNITRDLSQALQALVILSVSADGLWAYFKKKFGERRKS